MHNALALYKNHSMNKTAVITGASKGIGKAVAERFASERFDLIIIARTGADLDNVKREFEERFDIQCLTFAADLSVNSEANAFCDFVLAQNTPIDVLVNNTGVFIQGELMNEPDGALEKQINTNLYSAYWVTRGLIRSIQMASAAHIFNVCSIASLTAYAGSGSYSISKFALLGFSKSLREELKKDRIKVTSIMPGATYTSSWEGVDLPESRFMGAKDVADTIWSAYSLSPSAVIEDIIMRPLEGDI